MKRDGSQRGALRLAETLGGVRYSNLAGFFFLKADFYHEGRFNNGGCARLIILP